MDLASSRQHAVTLDHFMLQAFQLPEIMAVVVLICGCCPGGTVSNILALALQGDMNLRYAHNLLNPVNSMIS